MAARALVGGPGAGGAERGERSGGAAGRPGGAGWPADWRVPKATHRSVVRRRPLFIGALSDRRGVSTAELNAFMDDKIAHAHRFAAVVAAARESPALRERVLRLGSRGLRDPTSTAEGEASGPSSASGTPWCAWSAAELAAEMDKLEPVTGSQAAMGTTPESSPPDSQAASAGLAAPKSEAPDAPMQPAAPVCSTPGCDETEGLREGRCAGCVVQQEQRRSQLQQQQQQHAARVAAAARRKAAKQRAAARKAQATHTTQRRTTGTRP